MKEFFSKHNSKIAFFCFFAFVALGIIVSFFPVIHSEIAISLELQESEWNVAQPFLAWVSFFGIPSVAFVSVVLASLVFFFFSYRREAVFVLATFVADGLNAVMKYIIDRPRPTTNVVEVLQKLTDPSYPSGHVVHSIVFFGFLYAVLLSFWKPKRWIFLTTSALFLFLVVSVSVSRIYLGAHWATDVLGAYFFGFGMLWLILFLYFRGKQSSIV